jgi:DNA-binding MarR family transcriptional regulator
MFIMKHEDFDTAITDFLQAIGLLVRRVRTTSNAQDLSLTHIAVLARLDQEGPATISDLARAEGVKPQSMGAIVAALETEGLVERKPHPTDGRQVHIELTATGTAMRKERAAAKQKWLAQAVAQLDPQEQATLFAATKIIRRLGDL